MEDEQLNRWEKVAGGPAGFGVRTLVMLASLVVVVAGLHLAQAVLLPLLVAAFLSILSTPPVLWLESRRVPAWLAVLLVMVVVLVVLTGFGALLVTSVGDFQDALPRYRGRLDEYQVVVTKLLGHLNINISFDTIGSSFDPSSVMDVVGRALGGLMAAVSYTGLVLLTMLFMLLEVAGFPRKLRAAFGGSEDALERFGHITIEIQRYLLIKTGISLATGLIIGLYLWLLGVDFPLLWGLMAFLLNYIPSVGSVIASVPAILIAFIHPGPGYAIATLGGYLAVNTVIGNVIEPQLMGRKLGLSPLVVFVSLAFWGWVWGPVGMLLSVPLTMIVKITLERSTEFHWVAVLLDAAPKLDKATDKGQRS